MSNNIADAFIRIRANTGQLESDIRSGAKSVSGASKLFAGGILGSPEAMSKEVVSAIEATKNAIQSKGSELGKRIGMSMMDGLNHIADNGGIVRFVGDFLADRGGIVGIIKDRLGGPIMEGLESIADNGGIGKVIMDSIKGTGAAQSLVADFEDAKSQIADAFDHVANGAMNSLGRISRLPLFNNELAEKIGELISPLTSKASDIGRALGGSIIRGLESIADRGGIFRVVADYLADSGGIVGIIRTRVGGPLLKGLSAIAQRSKGVGAAIASSIGSGLSNGAGAIAGFSRRLFDGMVSGAKRTMSVVSGVMTKGFKVIASSISASLSVASSGLTLLIAAAAGAVAILGSLALGTPGRGRDRQNFDFEFGEQAEKASEFSKGFAKEMATGIESVNGMMLGFNKVFKDALPFSESEMMSEKMTKLSVDVASYVGISRDAASSSLAAALEGDAAAAKTIGVNMTEASLKMQLLANGVDIVSKSATKAEVIMARYAIVQRETAAAVGHYNREGAPLVQLLSDTAAIGADVSRSFGDVLRPSMAKVVGKLIELQSWVRDNVTWLDELGESIGQVTGNILRWLPATEKIGGAMESASQSVAKFINYLSGNNFEDISDIFLSLADTMDIFTIDARRAFEMVKAYGMSALLYLTGGVLELGRSFISMMGDGSKGLVGIFRSVIDIAIELINILTQGLIGAGVGFIASISNGIKQLVSSPALTGFLTAFSPTLASLSTFRGIDLEKVKTAGDGATGGFKAVTAASEKLIDSKIDSMTALFRGLIPDPKVYFQASDDKRKEFDGLFNESRKEKEARDKKNKKDEKSRDGQSTDDREFSTLSEMIFTSLSGGLDKFLDAKEERRSKGGKFEFVGIRDLNRTIQQRIGQRSAEQEKRRREKEKLEALKNIKKASDTIAGGVVGLKGLFGFGD